MKNKTKPKLSLDLLKFKNKHKRDDILDRLEIKNFVIPEVYKADDSTINHIKRVGGQVLQMYAMHVPSAAIRENIFPYYLISDIYPIETEIDYSQTRFDSFNISIINAKKVEDTGTDKYASLSAKPVSLDIVKYKEYTTKQLPIDSYSSTSANLFSMDVIDYIRYTTHNISEKPLDTYSSYRAGMISLDYVDYPFLDKTTEIESTKTDIVDFNIKVKQSV